MGRFNKYSVGVGSQRSVEKKYLLGAGFHFFLRAARRFNSPSYVVVRL